MDTKQNWYDLKKSFIQQLNDEWCEHIKKSEDEQREWISEVVDSTIPVYTQSLLEIAESDITIAVEEPELLAFDGKKTAVSVIAGVLYERLQEAGQEWLDEQIKQRNEN